MLSRQVSALSRRLFCSVPSNLGNEFKNAKPFSEVPKVSAWRMIKSVLPGGRYYKKPMSEVIRLMYEDYGVIFKIPPMFGKPSFVITYSAENFEKVFRAEGVWPVRYGLETLDYYRSTKRQEVYGDHGNLFVSHGEKWSAIRTVANPILMQPKTMKNYMTQIDDIAKEFIQVMKNIRNEKSEMPGDFSNHVNTWSLESVATVALERRLNLFDENTNDENAKKLIKSIREFFEKTVQFDGEISIWKYYQTKSFKSLIETYDNLTDVILHYVNQAIEDIKREESNGNDKEESILRKLLKVDKKVAIIVVSDLMLAGVDTTATGVLNNMYMLAKNPEKQEILRQELTKILPTKDSKLTPEKVRTLPYLRAVIKETHRMLPVVMGNARMTQKDVVLSGYHIPPNVHVGLHSIIELRNEKYFPEPEKFVPERWLRKKTENCPQAEASNPFVFLPFGFGARSCIGKRIAELELETLLINIIRNFKLEWHHEDMKIKSTFVNIPDSEMRFKVVDV